MNYHGTHNHIPYLENNEVINAEEQGQAKNFWPLLKAFAAFSLERLKTSTYTRDRNVCPG